MTGRSSFLRLQVNFEAFLAAGMTAAGQGAAGGVNPRQMRAHQVNSLFLAQQLRTLQAQLPTTVQ
jgi:hypothetical protein